MLTFIFFYVPLGKHTGIDKKLSLSLENEVRMFQSIYDTFAYF